MVIFNKLLRLMNISISQFLQTAGPAILDRGRSYFKNGHVISFEEIQPGEYEAVVEGTEDYLGISDPEFRRSFISGFLYKISKESPEMYRKLVNELILFLRGNIPSEELY